MFKIIRLFSDSTVWPVKEALELFLTEYVRNMGQGIQEWTKQNLWEKTFK